MVCPGFSERTEEDLCYARQHHPGNRRLVRESRRVGAALEVDETRVRDLLTPSLYATPQQRSLSVEIVRLQRRLKVALSRNPIGAGQGIRVGQVSGSDHATTDSLVRSYHPDVTNKQIADSSAGRQTELEAEHAQRQAKYMAEAKTNGEWMMRLERATKTGGTNVTIGELDKIERRYGLQ